MKKIILILIIILAFILRFYKLDSYPAINADEASIGYDAYSLLETGRDQHGNSWPINFQSFNDYKPGFYVYMVMPFVKVLGLNSLAVRIPNALLGVASVYLIYLFVKRIFEKEEVAMVASFFLTVSPWHLHFSRGGWESNTATFFLLLGVYLWIQYFNSQSKNIRYLIFSILSFVASIYTYQATRVITPLIGIGLILIYRNEIFSDFKKIRNTFIFGIILLIPLVLDFSRGAALSRASGVGLFADQGAIARIQEQRGEHGNINSIFGKTIHNKAVNYGLSFLDNWSSHFHGEFLFLTGDEVQRNRVPEIGVMYLVDIPFLILGLIFLIKTKSKYKVAKQILVLWVLVGPVASALTFQAPSALRAQSLLIPFSIISAYGAVSLIKKIRKINDKKLSDFLLFSLRMIILWNIVRYGHLYYVHMAKEYPYSSQYGVKELVDYINKNESKYEKVLITDRYDQPYILFLYYLKYPPSQFQNEHILSGKDNFGFSTVRNFAKYEFSSIKFDEAINEGKNVLIVGTEEEIPKEAKIVKDIYGSNGFLYFRIAEN